jgi:hypothetical protein
MFGVVAFAVFSFTVGASATQVRGVLRKAGNAADRAGGFVKALQFKHRLRVCNAYPYAGALDVYRGKNERLTGDAAMPYKTCKDFVSPMNTGDKLEFKVGDATAGTFSVSDLPNNDAVLLLVIHRHDATSTAVAFESHVFASLLNAQVAIIDTYKGSARASPRIMDSAPGASGRRSEELRYDSVVAVNPGKYEVVLAGQDGQTKATSELVALNRESYVVLRTGVEAQRGQSYPQELVVFPQSPSDSLEKPHIHSSAAWRGSPAACFLALVAVFLALYF